MKKVLLCGASHGSNFGDSLFVYMFKKSLENSGKDFDILFTQASEHSKETLNIEAASFKDILNSEGMIYISGGYFGESHEETLKGSVQRFRRYFSYGLLMIIKRKPIAIIGVGAGPFKRKFLRKAAVNLFNKAKVVSVRDDVSKEYMLSYGVKNAIEVTSDSAQVIDTKEFGIKNSKNYFFDNVKLNNRKKVLVHLNTTGGGDLYNNIVIKAILETLGVKEEYGFILTTDSIVDPSYLKSIYKQFPENRTVIYNFENPIDFLNIIESVDSIITPKLHVGILGSTYGKPVVSFPIHPGKTERYYHQIGYPEHCKSLFELNLNDAKNMILNNISKEITLNENIRYSAQRNFVLLDKFTNEYL